MSTEEMPNPNPRGEQDMALTIFAGGCRYTTDDGKTKTKHCNECFSQGTCELEPRARELAEIISRQWVSTENLPPPEETAILYLEYPSETLAGTVYLGYYEADEGRYLELATGEALSEQAVIAWMTLPEVPEEIYKNRQFARQRPGHLAAARTMD
jgi:hypothetical protein